MTQPARAGISLVDDGVDDGLCLVAAPTRNAQLRTTRCAANLVPGGRVDFMLGHPFPVLFVHVGPLCPEFGAAVAGLDVALLRGVFGVGAAAGGVPPARLGC